MRIGEAAKPVGDVFGGRFFLVGYLPSYAAALFLLVLLWSGAPGELRFSRAWKTAADLDAGQVLLLILAITLAALVAQPLQLRLVRLLEGYWPARLDRLAGPLRRRHRRRRRALARAAELPAHVDDVPAERLNRLGEAGTELLLRYPAEDRVRPTALGNVLAAGEARAGAASGWDAVVAWPRLYPVLGDRMRQIVDDRRNTLDATVRLEVMSVLSAVAAGALLAGSGWWFWLTLVPAGVGLLAHRAVIEAALAYCESVEVAFDLHRLDLIAALRLPLPADLEAEVRQAADLSAQWRQGVTVPTVYRHQESSAHDTP
ncbi:hypothetical protein [Microbispora sp. NPDC049125]|uniref:hypothetical protein n=1 Tax=Microbispora sp. NPDC049125 TaxID=3154929 RepID=UPI0034679F0C